MNITWYYYDTIEVIHSNNKLSYMLCHIRLLLGIYNVGEVGNIWLAISGCSGWHILIYLAVLNASGIGRLPCSWLKPLAELAAFGVLGFKPFSHKSQLLGGFSYMGCLKCIFKPTIKLSKYYQGPKYIPASFWPWVTDHTVKSKTSKKWFFRLLLFYTTFSWCWKVEEKT